MNEPMIKALVLSCSLNPKSNSAKLAECAKDYLDEQNIPTGHMDLRKLDMPFCGVDAAYDHESVGKLKQAIEEADAVLLAAPVYNYDLNAAAKNVIELTGSAWENKVVGFMCAAGGSRSYMSPIGLANSLMFDFRSYIVPRFVYATRADFEVDDVDGEVKERINALVDATLRLATGLALTAD